MIGVTEHFAKIARDNLVHILSDGSGGEWKLCCGNHWFDEILRPDLAFPTCLACIVEDARWWAQFK